MTAPDLIGLFVVPLEASGIPYMVTGVLNQHPRAGMKFNISEDKGDMVKFYDMITDAGW